MRVGSTITTVARIEDAQQILTQAPAQPRHFLGGKER